MNSPPCRCASTTGSAPRADTMAALPDLEDAEKEEKKKKRKAKQAVLLLASSMFDANKARPGLVSE